MRRYSWSTLILLLVLLTSPGCQPQGGEAARKTILKVSLASSVATYSGLIPIAEARGFFKECGLEVSEKLYSSGREASEALIRGEAQMATCADMVFADKVFDDPTLRVVASIGSSGSVEIVARKDRGIHKPSDLKGRKVGFSPGTASEYYLDSFLLANALSSRDVNIIRIPAERITEAIVNGEVDAISTWDSIVYGAKKRLGDNAVSWPAQNYVDFYWLLIAREDLTRSPEPIRRFLRALLMAEDYLLANDKEAQEIIRKKWNLEPQFVRDCWEKTRLSVTLNQSMLTSLENIARWRMAKEGGPQEMPNYLKHIFTGALVEVAPRAVTLFR